MLQLSSLPLQILVYFNWWYAAFFFVVNIALFIYKGKLTGGMYGYLGDPAAFTSLAQVGLP